MGLGMMLVNGLSLVPLPAAKIMAFITNTPNWAGEMGQFLKVIRFLAQRSPAPVSYGTLAIDRP